MLLVPHPVISVLLVVNNEFTLSSLRCVGACGLAPVVQVNGKTYGNATLETVKQIIEEYSKEEN